MNMDNPHSTFTSEICVALLQQLNQQQVSSETDLIFTHQILNGILKLFMQDGVELYRNSNKFRPLDQDP